MRKSVVYSQNYLVNHRVIADLVSGASIAAEDVVYEIGPGRGAITNELIKHAKKVIAYEIDEELCGRLQRKYEGDSRLEVRLGDVLNVNLPDKPYKVFSNIPFSLTSDIVRKLTQTAYPPSDIYLIVQQDAAKKFIGKPYTYKNSLFSSLLAPWFEVKVAHDFKNRDFFPSPRFRVVLLNIKQRKQPLVQQKDKQLYYDFVAFTFAQFKPNVIDGLSVLIGKDKMVSLSNKIGFSKRSKPSDLEHKHWIELFDYFLKYSNTGGKSILRGFYQKQQVRDSKLVKINRTRKNPDWRKL